MHRQILSSCILLYKQGGIYTLSEVPRNFELVTQQDADIELLGVTIIAELEAIKLYDQIVLLCRTSTSKDYSSL